MAPGWDLVQLLHPWAPPPLPRGPWARGGRRGMWGRRCRGAHGGVGSVGAILAPCGGAQGASSPAQWGCRGDPEAGTGKAGPWIGLAGGEQQLCHPSPKGGSTERLRPQPRSRVMAAHPGHGGESRSEQQPRAARASHPPHVPGSVTCGRPLDFGHAFNAGTHQTEAFPGYSWFCLKG